jgi:hypothetical protein
MGLSKRGSGRAPGNIEAGTPWQPAVVSPDGNAFAFAPAKTLQEALENWDAWRDLRRVRFPEALGPAGSRPCRARGSGSMARSIPATAH